MRCRAVWYTIFHRARYSTGKAGSTVLTSQKPTAAQYQQLTRLAARTSSTRVLDPQLCWIRASVIECLNELSTSTVSHDSSLANTYNTLDMVQYRWQPPHACTTTHRHHTPHCCMNPFTAKHSHRMSCVQMINIASGTSELTINSKSTLIECI